MCVCTSSICLISCILMVSFTLSGSYLSHCVNFLFYFIFFKGGGLLPRWTRGLRPVRRQRDFWRHQPESRQYRRGETTLRASFKSLPEGSRPLLDYVLQLDKRAAAWAIQRRWGQNAIRPFSVTHVPSLVSWLCIKMHVIHILLLVSVSFFSFLKSIFLMS